MQLFKKKSKTNVQEEELNNKLRDLDDETREAYVKLYGKKLDSDDSDKKDNGKKPKAIKKNGKKIKKKKQTPQQKTIAEVLSIVDEYNSDDSYRSKVQSLVTGMKDGHRSFKCEIVASTPNPSLL